MRSLNTRSKIRGNKIKSLKNAGLILLFLILQVFSLEAQDVPESKYIISTESELWFEGTSTLHGYKCVVREISGSFLVKEMISDSTLTEFNSKTITGVVQIPVFSIESGKAKMDKKIQKSMKAEEHPEIIFEIISAELTGIPEAGNLQLQLNAVGDLKIAGVEKVIYLQMTGNLEPNGAIRFTGSKELRMTDFDIKPPTMFFGTLKTGNEITVHFDLALVPSDRIGLNQNQDADYKPEIEL